jgi:protein pelota
VFATLLAHASLLSPPTEPPTPIHAGLVDSVRDGGGESLVFSSMHVSGEQLNQLSGIAAILRFPLPDLEDIEIPDEI